MYPRLIAHRGNVWGPSNQENYPKYIQDAISSEFDVEIDLWKIGRSFFLGHDAGEYKIPEKWLYANNASKWFHCKNLEALKYCLGYGLHCFWHQKDDYTLTSEGFLWVYPGKEVPESAGRGVVLVDKKLKVAPSGVDIICSDYVGEVRKNG
jgi:hypothetical protein